MAAPSRRWTGACKAAGRDNHGIRSKTSLASLASLVHVPRARSLTVPLPQAVHEFRPDAFQQVQE